MKRSPAYVFNQIVSLDNYASHYFTWRHLFEAGETWAALQLAGKAPPNRPQEPQSWEDYQQLAKEILDPLYEGFGPLQITYGFASRELTRHIPGRIAPALDQHAASEQSRGKLICPRRGAAVDVVVPGMSSDNLLGSLALLPCDRVYFYGPTRPIHISWSTEPARSLLKMKRGPSGRLIPKQLDWQSEVRRKGYLCANSHGWEVVCPDGHVRNFPYSNEGDAQCDAEGYSEDGCQGHASGQSPLERGLPPCPEGAHRVRRRRAQ
jgi:hypothetical protein